MRPDLTTPTLTAPVTLEFVGDAGHEGSLEADFTYDQHDPYAMSVVFRTAPPVVWTFARDLVLKGMYEPVGDGDVQVWPGVTDEGKAVVLMEFCSPDGQVTAQVDQRAVHAFVQQVLATVPAGREGDHVDLDSVLASLLGSSPDVSI